jgi:hypothetical protein
MDAATRKPPDDRLPISDENPISALFPAIRLR